MSDALTLFEKALKEAPFQDTDTTLADTWLLGFDTETTGVSPQKDAIVSASLVLRNPQIGYQGDVVAEWIINPHRHISAAASKINGFTDEYLTEHGQEPTEAIAQIADCIVQAQSKNIPLLAYNAPFDIHMLIGDIHQWCPASDTLLDSTHMLVIDPLVIDRAISNRRGKHTLEYASEYYGIVPHGDFHNATADTVAAVDLIEPMTKLYPQVSHLCLHELMEWQRQAHAEWASSYMRWAQATGKKTYMKQNWL